MKRILPWAAWFAVGFVVVMTLPAGHVIQGYRLAADADRHGIEIRMHHGGSVIRANPRALRGEMTLDRAEYDRLGKRGYAGGPWGLVTRFQGWGTDIYHAGR